MQRSSSNDDRTRPDLQSNEAEVVVQYWYLQAEEEEWDSLLHRAEEGLGLVVDQGS